MKDERAHLQLFDLIARDWALSSPVQGISFNADNTAVAFACADGGIHLAATADKASPNKRTRRAVDTGRLTIAPRDKPFAALKVADYTAGRSSAVVACGASGFAFAKTTGRINSLTPGGIAVHLAVKAPGPITAVAATPDGLTLVYACDGQVWLTPAKADAPQSLGTLAAITALAFSPDGRVLAVGHAEGVSRWAVDGLDQGPVDTPLTGPVAGLTWRDDATSLAVCLQAGGFCVIDMTSNTATVYPNFPSPVRSVAFNDPTQTVIASGAFRVAAWTLPDHGDVVTGKAGLVLIDTIATCPTRNLVAVGYANGLLSLAEIGRPSEILLREDTGAAITTMAWSGDGKYLALAGADGSAALVEFPDSMFKS